MMELPDGITTSDGNWYRINAEQIEKYIPGVLKKHSLESIIKAADAWVKSADGISLILYYVLLLLLPNPLYPFLISIAFFVFWFFNGSAFVNVSLSGAVKFITSDLFMYGTSALFLIAISLQETTIGFDLGIPFNAIWYGLVLFFGFKVGLFRLLFKYLNSKSDSPKAAHEDRVLNILLIRYGMKEGVLTGDLKKMQDDLIRVANYHKSRNMKK